MKTRLLAYPCVVAATALLLPALAGAQEAAGQVFLQVFNVGGINESLTNQFGAEGSIGCGGAGAPGSTGDSGGGDLIAVLNTVLGTNLGQGQGDLARAYDLFSFCDDMTTNTGIGWTGNFATPDQIVRRQEALAPDELFMQTDQAASLATLQITNVSQRIAQIRLARRGLGDLGGYAFQRPDTQTAQPVLAMEDAFGLRAPESDVSEQAFAAALQRGFSSGDGLLGIEGLSAFLNGEYTRLDASSSSHEVGSHGNGGGFTLGVDKQLGDKAFLGFAFGYSRLHTEYSRSFGSSDLDDFTFSLYGSNFFTDQLYADGIISGSILSFDQTRKVPGFSNLKSSPDGSNFTADLGFGGEFHQKPVDLNPYLRVAVSKTMVDSFHERGSTLALAIKSQDNTSVTLTPGLSVSLPLSTSFGVVSPYVRGEYVHEFKDQADDIRGNLALVPGAGFKLKPNGTDRDYANVGGGVTTTLGGGISAFVDYNALVGYSHLLVQKATIGGRYEF